MTNEHQDFERDWWGNCVNTMGEETKQMVYANRIGINPVHVDGKYPVYRNAGRILDIGGGPASILLKCEDPEGSVVVDPCDYPQWTADRYASAGIQVWKQPAESISELDNETKPFDEVWIYNVLQHVEDPEKIITLAKGYAPVLRLFEWVDIPAHEGHPHELTSFNLSKWIGQYTGTIEEINEFGCVGRAFYGVFTL